MHCYRSFMYREGIESNLRLGANPMLVFLSKSKSHYAMWIVFYAYLSSSVPLVLLATPRWHSQPEEICNLLYDPMLSPINSLPMSPLANV